MCYRDCGPTKHEITGFQVQTNKSVNRRHGAQLQLSRLMCTDSGYHRSPNMVSDIGRGRCGRLTLTSGHARSEDGCVLVRPDMHVAWRANGMADDPAAELLGVLSRVLALPI